MLNVPDYSRQVSWIHAIRQYYKCEHTCSRFRFILCICTLVRSCGNFLFIMLLDLFCVTVFFGKASFIFFFSLWKEGWIKTHYTIATILPKTFMSHFLSFPHIVNPWGFLCLIFLPKRQCFAIQFFVGVAAGEKLCHSGIKKHWTLLRFSVQGREQFLVHSHMGAD